MRGQGGPAAEVAGGVGMDGMAELCEGSVGMSGQRSDLVRLGLQSERPESVCVEEQ